MASEDLIEILEERPFVPVRLHMDDGRSHEIRHPETAIVTPTLVAIGYQGTSNGNGSRLVERIRLCSIAHVVEAEPIEAIR